MVPPYSSVSVGGFQRTSVSAVAGPLPDSGMGSGHFWQAESRGSEVCEFPRTGWQASRLKDNDDGNNLGSLKPLAKIMVKWLPPE